MNALLSILVCIAMLCSGGGAIPAQPETASTWTLSNLTISDGTNSVTLAPEARLTTAIGSEVARGHFEIVNGDDVLMPMSGELTADGARFSLGQNGNVYSITNDTLMELLDMDEDDAQALERFADVYESYAALLGRANDTDFQQEVSAAFINALTETCAVFTEDTEVEIDGTAYPAQSVRFEMTVASTPDLLDALANCGVTELEDVLSNYVLMFSTLSGEDYDSFEAFTAELRKEAAEFEEDISIPMTMTTVEQDGVSYAAMGMDFEQDGVGMKINAVATLVGEVMDSDMTMTMTVAEDSDDETSRMAITLSEQVVGPVDAPEKVHMDMVMSNQSHSGSEYTDGDGATHRSEYNNDGSMTLTMDAVATGDNMADVDMTMGFTQSFDNTYDGETYGDDVAVNLTLTERDRLEEDGSVTAAIAMNIDTGDHKLDISFDLNLAEGAAVDYFEGAQVRELPAETSDAAYGQLATELLSVAADAAALAADDSVIAMTQFLGVPEEELYDGDDGDDEDYEYYGATVSSFEEAAEIYEGEMPEFTAPEGVALQEIEVSSDYFDAYYASEAQDRSFHLSAYTFPDMESASYALENGALRPVRGTVNFYLREDGSVETATIEAPGCRLYFYFDGIFDQEQAETIVSGLKF